MSNPTKDEVRSSPEVNLDDPETREALAELAESAVEGARKVLQAIDAIRAPLVLAAARGFEMYVLVSRWAKKHPAGTRHAHEQIKLVHELLLILERPGTT
jgi:hypothetical protein